MSCHGCATKFGLWTKENGCPSCGFSFCNSCLKYKCAVPKLENKICKVCKRCSDSFSSSSKDNVGMDLASSRAPPDIFLKRLEALDSPPKPPVTVYRAEPRLKTLMKGLSSTDLDIARRLEKLREDRRAAKCVPPDEEIARRLAHLKGQDTDDFLKKPSYGHVAPDTRSAEEKTKDLFTQCKEEVDLDGKLTKPEDEIAKRLNRLRNDGTVETQSSALKTAGKDIESITLDEIAQLLVQCKMEASETGQQPDLATIASLEKLRNRIVQQTEGMDEDRSSDEDEEKAASKILSRVQAEVELEKQFGSGKPTDEEEIMDTDNDMDELPWCIICNEDAKIRCLGCDRDLYCKTCFQEGHADDDMKSHSFEPFKLK